MNRIWSIGVLWLTVSSVYGEEPSPTVPKSPILNPREMSYLANPVQLTTGGSNAECYWRPDGKGFIFQSTRGSFTADQIYTMAADGKSQQLVSTGTGRTTCGYYFPDGQRILYASTHAFSSEVPPRPDRSRGYVWPCYSSYEIFVAQSDGTSLRQLTKNHYYDAEATVCWSTGKVVFTSDRDGDYELYTMDLDGSNLRQITDTLGYDGGAFFSSDGSKIVWRASRPKTPAELQEYRSLLKEHLVKPMQVEVFVANADGSEVMQLTDNGAANFAPYFFPDGKYIIFSSNMHNPESRSPDFDLYMMKADGSNIGRLTFDPAFDAFPMFSPNGKKLVWVSGRGVESRYEFNVFVADWKGNIVGK